IPYIILAKEDFRNIDKVLYSLHYTTRVVKKLATIHNHHITVVVIFQPPFQMQS
uniref:Uncharacterized protein n=1 Tax=Ciona intestinalis TaxID=7719 RepID=H2XSS2_CIOIN